MATVAEYWRWKEYNWSDPDNDPRKADDFVAIDCDHDDTSWIIDPLADHLRDVVTPLERICGEPNDLGDVMFGSFAKLHMRPLVAVEPLGVLNDAIDGRHDLSLERRSEREAWNIGCGVSHDRCVEPFE